MKRCLIIIIGFFAVLSIFSLSLIRDEKFPRKSFKDWNPEFKLHQPDLFKEAGALTNAFADFDNDGDLDLFVGFRGKPNRLYQNDKGKFKDVAAQVGLADSDVTRTAAWGDYNGDGHMDLFVGFVSRSKSWNRLYHNDGGGKHFTDVTKSAGVKLTGSFRQASWIDFDNDGDMDLFVGLRDKPNVLFQNSNGKFIDLAKQLGIDDSRRTGGAAWFDYDKDGDLDCYVTNMDGDANGLYRNDGLKFVDVAKEAGVETVLAMNPERLEWVQNTRVASKLFETAQQLSFLLTTDPRSSTPEDLFIKLVTDIGEMGESEFEEFQDIITGVDNIDSIGTNPSVALAIKSSISPEEQESEIA